MTAVNHQLARSGYDTIPRYAVTDQTCAIDLSDNTNLWGAPPSAEAVMRDIRAGTLARYPEAYADTLKASLARYLSVRPDQLVTGCGSDDVLDAAIRAFAEPGSRIAVPDPSFVMVPLLARANGLEPVAIPLTSAYDMDVERTLAAGARIIYLCSPNNPTGVSMSAAAIEEIAARSNGFVIIDEAYAEFAERSIAGLIERSDRVLVTRTMSKAFGLAGLRVGYAIGAPALVAEVEKARGPYKIGVAAERAAAAALDRDVSWMQAHVRAAVENRTRFVEALRSLGLEALPSDANFVLVPVAGAVAIADALRRRGVAVRAFAGLRKVSPALATTSGGALRITIGPWGVLETALSALREVLDECA